MGLDRHMREGNAARELTAAAPAPDIRKVRIVGDGTWFGTRVETMDGARLAGLVRGISLTFSEARPTEAQITVLDPALDVILELVSKAELDFCKEKLARAEAACGALREQVAALQAERGAL